MIEKVEMYTVVCDHCKKNIGEDQDYSCWGDESTAEDNAMNSDWIEEEGRHYCDLCYITDDNDVLVLPPERKDFHAKNKQ